MTPFLPPVRPAARLLPAAALLVLLMTSACASSGRVAPVVPEPSPAAAPAAEEAPAAAPGRAERGPTSARYEALLRAEVRLWEGTPHVLGGTGRDGLDCSAFVQNVYRDLFAMELPRTTDQQVDTGKRAPEPFQPGDLVFFQPSRKSNHVGIYLSDGEFAHVSSSRGVMISRLEEDYWQDAYWTTRRLLPDVPAAPVASTETAPPRVRPAPAKAPEAAPKAAPEQAEAPTRRVGW